MKKNHNVQVIDMHYADQAMSEHQMK